MKKEKLKTENEKLKMKYETFKSKRENEILKIENVKSDLIELGLYLLKRNVPQKLNDNVTENALVTIVDNNPQSFRMKIRYNENFIVLNYNVLNGNVYIVPRDKNTMNLIGNLWKRLSTSKLKSLNC